MKKITITITGTQGAGKSLTLEAIAAMLISSGNRVVAFDERHTLTPSLDWPTHPIPEDVVFEIHTQNVR